MSENRGPAADADTRIAKQEREMERTADEMEQRSDELGDQIEETRDDWERKRRDPGVSGANPPEPEEDAVGDFEGTSQAAEEAGQ